MTWRVELDGHEFDLEELDKWLAGSGFDILREGDRYLLRSASFEFLPDPDAVTNSAEELLEVVNGVGRLLWQDFEPVSVGVVRYTRSDGSEKVFVQANEVAGARDKARVEVISSDGVTKPDPGLGAVTRLIPLVSREEPVQRALRLLSRTVLRWTDLYRAWEVVREDVGDVRFEQGWISKNQERRFRRTANSYRAIGLQARHGDTKFEPPANPLDLLEAKGLILGLVRSWVRSKAQELEREHEAVRVTGGKALRR